jgi:hypothetical protein
LSQPVEHAFGLEHTHQGEHDHHDRQQDEESKLNGRTASLEDDVDQDFHCLIRLAAVASAGSNEESKEAHWMTASQFHSLLS